MAPPRATHRGLRVDRKLIIISMQTVHSTGLDVSFHDVLLYQSALYFDKMHANGSAPTFFALSSPCFLSRYDKIQVPHTTTIFSNLV